MAGFGDILNEKDTEMIRQYVISRALIDKAEAEAMKLPADKILAVIHGTVLVGSAGISTSSNSIP